MFLTRMLGSLPKKPSTLETMGPYLQLHRNVLHILFIFLFLQFLIKMIQSHHLRVLYMVFQYYEIVNIFTIPLILDLEECCVGLLLESRGYIATYMYQF